MAQPDILYDVYHTPRIGPVQFGDFVAADGREREIILQGAKFVRRSHKARAWFARQEITNYLLSPKKNLGNLDAALDDVKETSEDMSLSEGVRVDAAASVDCLSAFIAIGNKLPIFGKDILAVDEDQFPVKIAELSIQLDFTCLLRSVDKGGNDRIGALYINTHKGKGLGTKEATIAKRKKAGETVALLVFKRLMDEFSDLGQPYQQDAIHLYLRAQHYWCAPASYTNKLGNIAADARAIIKLWDTIESPSDFDPDRARFHE